VLFLLSFVKLIIHIIRVLNLSLSLSHIIIVVVVKSALFRIFVVGVNKLETDITRRDYKRELNNSIPFTQNNRFTAILRRQESTSYRIMATEYQQLRRSSSFGLSCSRYISRPFHSGTISTFSTWATSSTTTAKRKLSRASSFSKMSPSTSANSSQVVSPASSTSSMSEVLDAAMRLDIANRELEMAISCDEESVNVPDKKEPPVIVTAETDTWAENSAEFLEPHRRTNSTIAFAFDIDGVLVRSQDALPGATQTIRMLQRRKIPFILLTNGGGSTEKDHVALLGRRLGVQGLHERQFVQSHTPYLSLVPTLANKNILVLGGTGSKIRDVAHAYGFKNVVIPSDLVKDNDHVYPFLEYTKNHHIEHGIDVPRMEDGRVQIHAILVWSSPRDSGLDQQVILDLLLSEKGIMGTRSKKNGNTSLPNNGYLQDNQPPIYFCNPDLTWATAYLFPRAAQGLFKAAFEGAWAAVTNNASLSSHVTLFGKPTEATYVFGERVLQDWHKEINGVDAKPIRAVYMIGDNPDSDIQGSKNYQSRFGSEWKSVLVESGVHVRGTEPAHEPTHIAAGVKEAVELVLMKEGFIINDVDYDTSKVSQSLKCGRQ
jgi:HAD superfamily hydrolase (TIGR01456 family)